MSASLAQVQRYDAATITAQSLESTPQGVRARARFTRSGVLEYDLEDGTVRREWRPPEEVFAPESYKTLHDVPITVHHPDEGEVHGDNYRRETVGHVSADVVPDAGEFLAGTAVLRDESTVRQARNLSLTEFSAGYLSLLDPTPGVVPAGMPDAGKPYDVIQRRIRYNHVAILPPGTGRAGSEVGILRLDSRGNQIGPLTPKAKPMDLTPEELAALKGLAAVAPKLTALAAAPTPAAPPPAPAPAPTNDAPPAAAPAAEPKKDEVVPNPEEKKNDAAAKAKAKAEAAAEQERIVNDSLELRDQARTVLGSDYSFKGKSNEAVMIDVVKHVDSAFELGQRSADYLRGRFESALTQHADRQHAALRAPVVHTDSSDDGDEDGWMKKRISGSK